MSSLKAFSTKIFGSKYFVIFLIFLIILSIIARIISLPIIGFHGDFGVFNTWARDLQKYGLAGFYQNSSCNYLPIYVYFLKFSLALQPLIGHLNSAWSHDQVVWISYKLPSFVFDLLTGLAIYLFIAKKTKNKTLGLGGAVFYLFNPVIYHNTYIYGQDNVLLYLPTVLLFYMLAQKRIIIAGIAAALLLLIKPTGIIIVPFVLLFLILENGKNYRVYLKFLLAFYITLQLLILPFYFRLPWEYAKMFILSLTSGNGYKVTQMYSYNLWYLLTGSDAISDTTRFLGKSYNFWGQAMFAAVYCATLLLLYRYRLRFYLILATVIYFSFFIFPTRVHEAYLLFAFPILILAVFIYRNYFLAIIYIIETLVYSYNIWGYWPWRLSRLPLHYGGRLALPAAIIITIAPAVLIAYYIFINDRKVKSS